MDQHSAFESSLAEQRACFRHKQVALRNWLEDLQLLMVPAAEDLQALEKVQTEYDALASILDDQEKEARDMILDHDKTLEKADEAL